MIAVGPLSLVPTTREARVGETLVPLTAMEFGLLLYLAQRAGTVVSRDELLAAVWGFRAPGVTRTVDVHVASLRRRLGAPDLIQTVRGVGYTMPL